MSKPSAKVAKLEKNEIPKTLRTFSFYINTLRCLTVKYRFREGERLHYLKMQELKVHVNVVKNAYFPTNSFLLANFSKVRKENLSHGI